MRITDAPPQTRVDDDGKVVPIKKSDIIGQAGNEEQQHRARRLDPLDRAFTRRP